MTHSFKRGVYETVGGFSAFVPGPHANKAFDLSCGEEIPMQYVTPKLLREVTDEDLREVKAFAPSFATA